MENSIRTIFTIWILFAMSFANGIRRFERDLKSDPEVVFGLNADSDEAVEVPVNAKEGEFDLDQHVNNSSKSSADIHLGKLVANQVLGRDPSRQGYPINNNNFAPGVPNLGSDISSLNDARLELAPGSELSGSPGQLVNVVFLLLNLGEAKYFYISVNEQQGGFSSNQVSFPQTQQTQFLNGLSEQRPYLRRNETRNIVLALRIPQNTFAGTNKTITLEVQPDGVAGTSNTLIRRFYFSVSTQTPSFTDRSGPSCSVPEDTRTSQCSEVINNPGTCRQRRWSGKFEFADYDSGLRSLEGREAYDSRGYDVYYSYNNFVIGTKLPAQFSFQVSCCINSYSVAGSDLAGNEEVCVAGEGATKVQFGSLQITITVVVIVLALVIVIGIIIFCLVKKRRNIELAEMRSSPQAR